MSRVASGMKTAPTPINTPHTIRVGPMPSSRPNRSATRAPTRKPTLPMDRTTPIDPALRPRLLTANSSRTAWPIWLKKLRVPVHARSGRISGWPAMKRIPSATCRRMRGRPPSATSTADRHWAYAKAWLYRQMAAT